MGEGRNVFNLFYLIKSQFQKYQIANPTVPSTVLKIVLLFLLLFSTLNYYCAGLTETLGIFRPRWCPSSIFIIHLRSDMSAWSSVHRRQIFVYDKVLFHICASDKKIEMLRIKKRDGIGILLVLIFEYWRLLRSRVASYG